MFSPIPSTLQPKRMKTTTTNGNKPKKNTHNTNNYGAPTHTHTTTYMACLSTRPPNRIAG